MAANTQEASGKDLVEKSSLYREFQAEREEIMKHRSKWRRGRQPSDKDKK